MSFQDLLLQMQTDVRDNLASEPDFANFPVLLYRKSSIAAEVSKRMPHLVGANGKVGCGLLVMMPMIEGEDQNISTPQGNFMLPIWAVENDEINQHGSNGTGVSAEALALAVRAYLHQISLRAVGVLAQAKRAVEPVPGADSLYPGCVAYQVLLECRISDAPMSHVAPPVVADNAGVITITCGTAGAAIYYTTDGSFPGPANSTGHATLYAATFNAPSGTTILAKAYLAGSVGSDIVQYITD